MAAGRRGRTGVVDQVVDGDVPVLHVRRIVVAAPPAVEAQLPLRRREQLVMIEPYASARTRVVAQDQLGRYLEPRRRVVRVPERNLAWARAHAAVRVALPIGVVAAVEEPDDVESERGTIKPS